MRYFTHLVVEPGEVGPHDRLGIAISGRLGALTGKFAVADGLVQRNTNADALLTEKAVGASDNYVRSLRFAFVNRDPGGSLRFGQILADPGGCLGHIDARIFTRRSRKTP